MSENPDQQKELKQEENTLATKQLDSNELGKKVENRKSKEHKFVRLQSLITSIMKKAGKEKKTDIGWWKIFGISVACYFPALVIVIVSFWLFKPASTSLQADQKNQPLTEEQKKQIAEEVNKISTPQQEELRRILARQTAIAKDPNSILAKGYIDGQIQQEAEEQAEKATKEEIDKLKADWKGDLFGQIAFPVIFAIASIFAAFAVKDILTEILKEQEKQRIKQDLILELKNKIVPNAINAEKFATRLKKVEEYANWLEYKLLGIIASQIIDEAKKTPEPNSSVMLAIDKTFARLAFNLSDLEFNSPDDLEKLRTAEFAVLQAKIKNLGLSTGPEGQILRILENTIQEISHSGNNKSHPGYFLDRAEEIYQLEMNLLIAKLIELGENELSRQLSEYIRTDRPRLLKERRKKAEEESSENPIVIEWEKLKIFTYFRAKCKATSYPSPY